MNKYFWSNKNFKTRSISFNSFGRSKRPHEHQADATKQIRIKVLKIFFSLFFVYLLYFLFFSSYFKINNITYEGTAINDELKSLIAKNIRPRGIALISKNNYFFISIKSIEKKLNNQGLSYNFKLIKKFPHDLIIKVEENLSTIIWSTQEQFYSINLKDHQARNLPNFTPASSTQPLIYDLSNTFLDENNKPAEAIISLALKIYSTFIKYDWPDIKIDYLKIDTPQSDYLKIVSKRGFEIQVDFSRPLEQQFEKLQKSLLADKIDLGELEYVNLRVENQVIYK